MSRCTFEVQPEMSGQISRRILREDDNDIPFRDQPIRCVVTPQRIVENGQGSIKIATATVINIFLIQRC